MNICESALPILASALHALQVDSVVPAGVKEWLQYSPIDRTTAAQMIYYPVQASYPTKVANLIRTFESRNVAPNFTVHVASSPHTVRSSAARSCRKSLVLHR